MGKVWTILKWAVRDFNENKCPMLAAALSYYTLFSLAPMLVIVIAVASLFMGNADVTQAIYEQARALVGSDGAESVRNMVESAYRPGASLAATAIGLATLLFGATTVFAQIQGSLNVIWGVRPKPRKGLLKLVRDRVLSLGMILVTGFLLLVSLVLNAALAIFSRRLVEYLPTGSVALIWSLELAASFTMTALLFGTMFKFLPDVKISWRDVRFGAFATAALFMLGRWLIGLYLGSSGVASGYGAAGALVVVILWVYYSSLIFFFGAEFTQSYATAHGGEIQPADYAVRVIRKELVAEVT